MCLFILGDGILLFGEGLLFLGEGFLSDFMVKGGND